MLCWQLLERPFWRNRCCFLLLLCFASSMRNESGEGEMPNVDPKKLLFEACLLCIVRVALSVHDTVCSLFARNHNYGTGTGRRPRRCHGAYTSNRRMLYFLLCMKSSPYLIFYCSLEHRKENRHQERRPVRKDLRRNRSYPATTTTTHPCFQQEGLNS